MNTLEELEVKKAKYLATLQKKRLMLGESDGAMISRFPTGRFELEDEIIMYENLLSEIQAEIDKLEARVKV